MKFQIFILGFFILFFSAESFCNTSRFYSIQFSSEISQGKANGVVQKLRQKGIDAFAVKSKVEGKVRYRVCAGYFDRAGQAKEARDHYSKIAKRRDIFVQSLKGSEIPNSILFPGEKGALAEW